MRSLPIKTISVNVRRRLSLSLLNTYSTCSRVLATRYSVCYEKPLWKFVLSLLYFDLGRPGGGVPGGKSVPFTLASHNLNNHSTK